MQVYVENLGVLKQAEFELGDLTLICGSNNTGKTYATYALYGFLYHWPRILEFKVLDSHIRTLFIEGVVRIDVRSYVKNASEVLKRGCSRYAKTLPKVFASRSNYFKNSRFQVKLQSDLFSSVKEKNFDRDISLNKTEFLSLTKKAETTDLVVSLLLNAKISNTPPEHIIKEIISEALSEIVFDHIFPKPFIASAERTGAAIFQKELNFSRNRLLEEMMHPDKDIDPMELLFKSYQDYALPVKNNADFIRQLETIAKEDSFVASKHPQILNDFSDIIGGEYFAGNNDMVFFRPLQKKIKLTMGESSSAVRSLLDIGFYLRHEVKRGDLLMIDEPELNLHPENQRRIARLFARLVNIGVKVFITTHSDYIVKELNTLIMLNHEKTYLKRIAKQEGYKANETLQADNVKVYVAKKALIKLKNNVKRSRCQTLEAADVNSELGIEVGSFDQTINKMNSIQDAIFWGNDG